MLALKSAALLLTVIQRLKTSPATISNVVHPTADRESLVLLVETSAGQIDRYRMLSDYVGEIHHVKRCLCSKRFENLSLDSLAAHLSVTVFPRTRPEALV
ncbi:hypothetical protein BBD46_02395 [Natrialba sp. SSL1]|nr:hypothetical protein BBD46_02395 [Natrialba sp. SSL1]